MGRDGTLDQIPIAQLEPSDGDECSWTLGWAMGRDETLDQTPIAQLGFVDVETAILPDDGCWQPSRKFGAGPAPPGECAEILKQQRLGKTDSDLRGQRLVQRRWQCVHCFLRLNCILAGVSRTGCGSHFRHQKNGTVVSRGRARFPVDN
jgi:hypothetical protein